MKRSSSLELSKVGGRERGIPNEGSNLCKVPEVRKRSSLLRISIWKAKETGKCQENGGC